MGMDPRIVAHAKLLVRYCLNAKRGETIGVEAGTPAEPLVCAVYEEVLRRGALPAVRLTPESCVEALYRTGYPHHFATAWPFDVAYARCVDKTIGIHAQANTRALADVDPRRQSALARANRRVSALLRKKPWVLTVSPTQAYAQEAGMNLCDYEDFVYAAMRVDEADPARAWRDLGRRQARLIARLRGARTVRIVGPDTDLTLSVAGRTFINSDGHTNMPSGEVYTSPVEDSAEGHIRFDFPVCRGGREIGDVRLVFRRGVVVEADASRNRDYLLAVMNTDAGARRVGELGIGTNYRVGRFTRHILFDEKIGGTVHLALGRGFAPAGGKNVSAIHWDMLKDLRAGGVLYADGKPIQENGKFAGNAFGT